MGHPWLRRRHAVVIPMVLAVLAVGSGVPNGWTVATGLFAVTAVGLYVELARREG